MSNPTNPDRQRKINWLTSKAVDDAMTTNSRSLGWYVSEYFSGLDDADLDQEFRDAGGDAPTKVWSSGWNIPGYLPDDEPMNCATWQEACDALADALGQATETGEEEMFLDYSNALKELSMAKRDTDWSIRIGNYVWWVQYITLPAERD